MEEKVYCIDCKHRKVTLMDLLFSTYQYRGRCELTYEPAHIKDDPVVGQTRVPAQYKSCNVARLGKSDSMNCGTDGKFWEPKSKKHLFLYLKRVR
jgi:hypothetical protein